MSLADSLELAAEALSRDADAIRPANGDPSQLLKGLDAAAAGRVLAWLLAHAAEDGEELVHAWLEEPDGVGAIGAIEEAKLPKAGRKVLRRALHAARSRGLTLPAVAAPKEMIARLPTIDEDLGAAYVSHYDPRGGRLVYIVESRPSGGARVFEALVDEDRGLIDFQVYRAGRSQVRDFVRDVTRRERFPAILADVDAVRGLIARSVELNSPDRSLPQAFGEWRGRLTQDLEGVATPGEQAREALGVEADESCLRAGVEVVEAREIGPWPPQPERLSALVEGVEAEIAAADLAAGDREALDAALEQRIAEGLATAYAGESAPPTAARFEETAYLYWQSEREDVARAFLSAAAALRAGEATANPVVRALLDVLRAALLEDLANRMLKNTGVDTESVSDDGGEED